MNSIKMIENNNPNIDGDIVALVNADLGEVNCNMWLLGMVYKGQVTWAISQEITNIEVLAWGLLPHQKGDV